MHRYSPVRNHRSKGIKIKHVLRICFLISVCCWLIFQIKRSHSHYKKKDFDSVDGDTKILSRENSVDEVIKLGRKDIQPKQIAMREEGEEEDDDFDDGEREIEGEKDDEIDENEQYKFDDEEDTVNESETANEAREEHYKADDASSAVTDEHQDQSLDTSKFLEMGISEHENQVPNGARVKETGSESANISSDSTRVLEESEASLKSTNMSAVVDPRTNLTTKENSSDSSRTDDETEEDLDGVQHDAIDSTDFIRLEDLDDSEDVAE